MIVSISYFTIIISFFDLVIGTSSYNMIEQKSTPISIDQDDLIDHQNEWSG